MCTSSRWRTPFTVTLLPSASTSAVSAARPSSTALNIPLPAGVVVVVTVVVVVVAA